MKDIIFVIGGCRSGKSRHALELAEQISADQRCYVATCVPHDDEMKQRVTRHQQERSNSWITVEEPVRLPEIIGTHGHPGNLLLIDCLTLWISNLMMETRDLDEIMIRIDRLTKALDQARCPVILVSNEVGAGIVPENPLARLFRDAAGFTNQKVAACADRVIWTVAGIPVKIKG
ncbi:MAG: bifunctional adenosylcobinamide kinase/adenosylcobinamide-phosphate guanylyltransferase [Desulfobacterales bacterium]|nr:bifunctional adenosylcobinamide kinase/adenosylcobinamide-phosphate guanylyltransferase [Desulfobacterales bacterium]MDD4070830.1 bifunctional adenosylcobinamide kinase/adenosylcobinamide-phosphate guanylyltransferase [Desulfobacterales bacterium]MDD4391232.1 bifunctional adenosylcobinamide kinase/adenosylcobinamide-phosphate guanylyltransferase [Desulfobacterales bacterium]